MPRALTPSADRVSGRHLPLKGGDAGRHASPSLLKGKDQGGGDAARVCLGVVAGAHGIKGLVRVRSFTADPRAIATYGKLQDESGARSFALDVVSESKGMLIARIAGIADRNAAELLKGVRLYVRRADLPDPAADEFYHADLVGLEAMQSDGTRLGTVRAVYDFGGGPSIEVEDEAGKMILVPFTTVAVPEVDIGAGKLVVAPPAGLFETRSHAEKVEP